MKRLILALAISVFAFSCFAQDDVVTYFQPAAAPATCSTYNLEQSNDVVSASIAFCKTDGLRKAVATSFTANSDYDLQRMSVKIDKAGSPSGNLIGKICEDDGSANHLPSSTCTTMGTLDASTVSGAFSDITQPNIGSGKSLSNGARYHLVVDCGTVSLSDTNYLAWIMDNTESGQTVSQYNGSSWSASYTNRQLNYRCYSCAP